MYAEKESLKSHILAAIAEKGEISLYFELQTQLLIRTEISHLAQFLVSISWAWKIFFVTKLL